MKNMIDYKGKKDHKILYYQGSEKAHKFKILFYSLN